jgi:geranylgeranyl diphosphate synthase type II
MNAAVTPAVIPQMLREYGQIAKALKSHLPSGAPRRHLYDLLADYPMRGGKMRPSLCIATACAFGACRRSAQQCRGHRAAAQRDVDTRRHRGRERGAPRQPTLHLLHGVPLAINAGDTLTLLSLQPLLANSELIGPRLSIRILEETQRMARESAEGQAMELGWRQDNVIDLERATISRCRSRKRAGSRHLLSRVGQ